MVETYPFPLSKNASTTVPCADLLGFDFKSKSSASSNTFSNNSFTPVPTLAEISCD